MIFFVICLLLWRSIIPTKVPEPEWTKIGYSKLQLIPKHLKPLVSNPHLSQDQLQELEERRRKSGYDNPPVTMIPYLSPAYPADRLPKVISIKRGVNAVIKVIVLKKDDLLVHKDIDNIGREIKIDDIEQYLRQNGLR